MTVSMNLHDVASNDRWRRENARLVAEFESKNGQVTTIPPIYRPSDTRVALVLDARKRDAAPVPKRHASQMALPVVRPDHPHPISRLMLNHAFKKLGIHKKHVAESMGVKPCYISNVCNDKQQVGDDKMREILACVWRLSDDKKND